MKRVELLIERSRRQTENNEFTDNTGIQDQEFVDFLSDAQQDLQSAIARQHQRVFTTEANFDIQSGQESYTLPSDIYLDNRVTNVWYSDDGSNRNFRRLDSGELSERTFNRSSTPYKYIRNSGKLLLSPIPSRSVPGGLKVAYVKRLPDLDIRRARISSVTTSDNQITSLILDTSQEIQLAELLKESYFCVVKPTGEQVMRSIPYTNINEITGAVDIEPSFVFDEGETISAGNYLVRGIDSTNISPLPDSCERYLSAYCDWKILKRDSSADSAEQTSELFQMREEIVDIFAMVDDDVKQIAIQDTQFIDDDETFGGW